MERPEEKAWSLKNIIIVLFTIEQLAPALKTTEYDSLRVDDLAKEENSKDA